MTPGNEDATFDVFADALDLPTSERPTWVREACAEAPTRRDEVLRLLARHEQNDSFLEQGGRWDVAPLAGAVLTSAPARPIADDAVGRVFAERYRLDVLLGSGGMGAVYRARDLRTGSDVAVKLLDAGSVERAADIRRELAGLRRLRVPGVVQLRDEGDDSGVVFLVMDPVDGTPFPGRPAPVPWDDLRETALGLIETLARVHARGVVHRDLKPANILVGPDGRATLLDLGIAAGDALDGPAGPRATIAGTPHYAPPEQMRGAPVAAAMDVYALGAMLYEALAGSFPSAGRRLELLLADRDADAVPPLDVAAPAVPASVATTVMEMLAGDAARRPTLESVLQRLGGASDLGARALRRLGESPPLAESDLRPLFRGPDRILHLREDAAHALWQRTGGDHAALVAELDAWARAGIVHEEDDLLVVTRRALDELLADDRPLRAGAVPLEPDASDDTERCARALRDAAAHQQRGRFGAAWAAVTGGLALARQTRNAAFERALLDEALTLAVRIGRPSELDAVLYEIERTTLPEEDVSGPKAVARAALLCLAGEGARALEALAPVAPFHDAALERVRMAVRVFAGRSLPLDRAEELVADASAWAADSDDPEARAALSGWLGWLCYRQDRYLEAAEHQLDLVAQTEDEFFRLSGLLSAGGAFLYVGAWDRAEDAARDALDRAAQRRDSLSEARAEQLLRSAAYRSGRANEPDVDLIDAVASLGVLGLTAQTQLNEAAVAWRVGESDVAARLASEAATAWKRAGQRPRWMLAAALELAARGDNAHGVADDVLAAARECPYPGLTVQAAALVSRAVPDARPACAALIRERASQRPRSTWPLRLEILAIEECVAGSDSA